MHTLEISKFAKDCPLPYNAANTMYWLQCNIHLFSKCHSYVLLILLVHLSKQYNNV